MGSYDSPVMAEGEVKGQRWLIVGLGNPGEEYRFTRHNIGFLVLERLAERKGITFEGEAEEAIWGAGEGIILAKPMTYVNRSGKAVKGLVEHWGVSLDHLLIVHDDIDLPFGRLRIKRGGGDGGHKGVRSIIASLKDEGFPRLKLGIGRPPQKEQVVKHVLGNFTPAEEEILPAYLDKAVSAVETLISEGIEAAMNRFNPPP